jgi:site-specific DNA recombinase
MAPIVQPGSTASAVRRAVGYARVSTDQQAGERHVSLATQQAHIAEYCARRGYALMASFVDVASGRKDDRAHYQKMLTLVRGGGADVIVVQYLDRFGRNPREILLRIWELQELGVRVEATDEDISEELVLLVRAGLAGAESRKIGERVRVTTRRAAQKGVHFGAPPYGFRLVPGARRGEPSRFEQVPEEARVVREMLRLMLDAGLGYRRIADRLNAMGARTRTGRLWAADLVRLVLQNEALVGTLVYGRSRRDANGRVVRANGDGLVRVPGVYPAILSPEEWHALQERRALRRAHPRGRTFSSPYLLSGLARCAYCGGALVGKTTMARGRRYQIYACANYTKARVRCAQANTHTAPKLEQAVLTYLAQYSDPERVRALLAQSLPRETERIEQELGEVSRHLAQLEEDFERNLDLLKRGVLNEEEFIQANQRRRQERASLESRRIELELRLETQRQQEALAEGLPARIRGFLEDVQALPVQQAKPLLHGILNAVYVSREQIELAFRQR